MKIDKAVFPYLLLRIALRFVLGKERRDMVFLELGWKRLSLFLGSLHFPKSIITKFKVLETQTSVKMRPFARERKVCSLLAEEKGKVFIDIGAKYGFYSFLLHNNFNIILAVEPHPDNLQVISELKKKYGYHKVRIIPKAVSDNNGIAELYVGKHPGAHNMLFSMGHGSITIKVTTLSKLLERYDRIDLIKMDVQGSEYTILEQSKDIIQKIGSWMIEIHTTNENDSIILRNMQMTTLMKHYGYGTLQIDENHIYAYRSEK